VLGEPLTKHISVKIKLRMLAADLSTLSFAVAYLSNYRLRRFGNTGLAGGRAATNDGVDSSPKK
jgi:hypothetical protein